MASLTLMLNLQTLLVFLLKVGDTVMLYDNGKNGRTTSLIQKNMVVL